MKYISGCMNWWKMQLDEENILLDFDGQEKVSIIWLKPKMEYVDGELYS